MRLSLIILFFFAANIAVSQSNYRKASINKQEVVNMINGLRANGCTCGGKYKAPAPSVSWHEKLTRSAMIHARLMRKYNFFGHTGPDGKDVADKMEAVGYDWHFAGENLGEGQKTFVEVFKDWIKSPTHCNLLMDPRMKDLGLVKKGKYWVLHMGKELPPRTKRVSERYTEH